MLVHLKDNVDRLIRQAEEADRASAPTYLKLLDRRRDWVRNEMGIETMLGESPQAPLGISENPYDLTALPSDPVDSRRKQYERMIDTIDRTMSRIWERMMALDE